MGFKMPKLSMPNLKIPNNSTKGMDRVQKFFTTHKIAYYPMPKRISQGLFRKYCRMLLVKKRVWI